MRFLRGAFGADGPLAVRPPGPVEVFVADLAPASLAVAAEADGWLPIWFDPAEVADAAHRRIAAYTYTAVDDDPARARDLVRRTAAWYLAANGTAYANLFRRRGFDVDPVVERWRAKDRDGARRADPDTLLERTALVGTPAQVRARLAEMTAAGVTDPVLRFPDELSADEIVRMLTALA